MAMSRFCRILMKAIALRAQNVWEAELFDFGRATVFLFETSLFKAQIHYICYKFWGGMAP